MFLLLILVLLFSNHINASKGAAPASQTQAKTNQQAQTPQDQYIQPQQQPTIIINNYQNNDATQTQANSNTNWNHQANSNANENVHTNTISLTNQIKQSILKFLNFAKKEAPRHQAFALSFFQKHKNLIFIGLCGCSYGLLFFYLLTLSNFLSDKEKWHSWKQETSIEDLALCNANELAHTLCITIQQKYFNPQDPANYMKPFARFYNDILTEMQTIDRYLQIASFINSLQLSSFFPVTKKRIKRAAEKKRKLEFIQKLLITHMATQNSMPIMRSYTLDKIIKEYAKRKRTINHLIIA